MSLDIKGFFDNVNHEFLLENYPIPERYRDLLRKFLEARVHYEKGQFEEVDKGFPQGSVLGPSLANYTLNGLEAIIKPIQKTKVDLEKKNYFRKLGKVYNEGNSRIRKTLTNRVIRFADDFVIITNDKEESLRIRLVVEKFLKSRGLSLNKDKSRIIE